MEAEGSASSGAQPTEGPSSGSIASVAQLLKMAPLVLFAAIFANANLNAKNIFGFALKSGIDVAAVCALCIILRSMKPGLSEQRLLLLAVPMYVVFRAFSRKIFKGIKYALKLGMSVPKTMMAIVAAILAALGVRTALPKESFPNRKLTEFFESVAAVVEKVRVSKRTKDLIDRMKGLLVKEGTLSEVARSAFAALERVLSRMQWSFPTLFARPESERKAAVPTPLDAST